MKAKRNKKNLIYLRLKPVFLANTMRKHMQDYVVDAFLKSNMNFMKDITLRGDSTASMNDIEYLNKVGNLMKISIIKCAVLNTGQLCPKYILSSLTDVPASCQCTLAKE